MFVMKKTVSCFSIGMILCLFLAGCAKEHTPAPAGSQVWETWPQVTYGQMESDKLEALDWNSGRCEATSYNTIAETELGFYYLNKINNYLYYCDKANFGNWVRVCGEPNCTHNPISRCAAYLFNTDFVVKDDRIYYLTTASSHRELYPGEEDSLLLVSCAANGTDFRLEYVLEDTMRSGGGSYSARLTSGYWLYNDAKLTPEGKYVANSYLINADGVHLLYTELLDEEKLAIVSPATTHIGVLGEPAYINSFLDTSLYYRVTGNTVEPVDLSGLTAAGAYLSGSTLRCFKQNDGYYDVDLNTREEIRLGDVRLENSFCQIVLPNCIIESTLLIPPPRPAQKE